MEYQHSSPLRPSTLSSSKGHTKTALRRVFSFVHSRANSKLKRRRANRGREGLEGHRRAQPGIDWRRNSYRRVDEWSRRSEEDNKMRRTVQGGQIREQSVGV